MVCLSESFITICSLTFLDRRIAAGMPSSRGEDWQPLLMYRNSLVHGETDQPPVTSKRAYSRKKKEYAGEVSLVIYLNKQFNLTEWKYILQRNMFLPIYSVQFCISCWPQCSSIHDRFTNAQLVAVHGL
jgi:hypothetical protein